MSRILAPLALVALLLAAWEIAVRTMGVPAYFLPPPSGVAVALVENLPSLAAAAWVTLSTALISLVQDWFVQNSKSGEVPDESTIRKRLSSLWRKLRGEDAA